MEDRHPTYPARTGASGAWVWIAFGETPPAGAWPAGLLIAIGVVVVIRSDQDAESELVDPGGLLT